MKIKTFASKLSTAPSRFILGILLASLVVVSCSGKKESDNATEFMQEAAAVKNLMTDSSPNPLRNDADAIGKGRRHYMNACAGCHGVDAKGLVGPSLVDEQWLHGNTDPKVYFVVMDGVKSGQTLQRPSRGAMPAFRRVLGEQRVLEVLAWIASKNPSIVTP